MQQKQHAQRAQGTADLSECIACRVRHVCLAKNIAARGHWLFDATLPPLTLSLFTGVWKKTASLKLHCGQLPKRPRV